VLVEVADILIVIVTLRISECIDGDSHRKFFVLIESGLPRQISVCRLQAVKWSCATVIEKLEQNSQL
jgi:hypothetical protein